MAAPPLDTSADAAALAATLETEAGTVTGGSFVARPSTGTPNALATVPVAGFPRHGGSYALLTTGNANLLTEPNNSTGSGVDNGGPAVHGDSAFDVTILKVDLQVPANVNCLLGFDFRFFSEEYPEYVGSAFNDGFVAELDKTTWTANGSTLNAPDNFAFDPAGKVISVNSSGVADMSPAEAAGTTYDAATGLLSAATPINPGVHALYLSIFDQGDHVLDSAIAIDALRFGRVKDPAKECVPGAKQAVAGIPLGQTFGKTGGHSPGGLPGYVPPGYAKNPSGNAGDPVNTATGAYTATVTDALLYTGAGPTDLTRSYTSADTTSGVLGRGWTHTMAAALTVQPSGDVLARAGNGQQVLFTKAADGKFAGPAGTLATLTSSADGFDLRTVDGRQEHFDTNGRLTRRTDRTGRSVELAYDTAGHLERATVSADRSFVFKHDEAGRLASVTLPDGRHVDYSYTDGLLTSVRDLAGGTTHYAYDSAGRLTQIVNQNGDVVIRSVYDDNGRVIRQTNAVGAETTFTWDAATQTSAMTDPNGGKWTDTYADGLLTGRSDPLGNRWSYTYDAALNATQVTDARGDVTTLEYDERGNITHQRTPDGAVTSATYTGADAPEKVTTPDGAVSTYAYDDEARPTSATSPDGTTFRYQRDASGLLTAEMDPNGAQTRYGYAANGDLASMMTPLGDKTILRHDAAGRLVKLIDPRGTSGRARRHTHRFRFDAADRLVQYRDPLDHTTSTSYDQAGHLTAITDANAHQNSYEHDAAGRLTAVQAADGSRTTYRYDGVGNLVARTDGNGHETRFAYDAANRLIRLTAPGDRTWTYAYDANGNLARVTDANGNATPTTDDGTTRYTWDSLGRVTKVDYSDDTPDVLMEYDAMSRLTKLTDGAASATFTYDTISRLTAVTRGSSTFRYTYDAVGRIASRQYPSGAAVTYGYDANGQLATVAAGGGTTRYRYDAAGNRTSVRSPNGVVETDTYDAANRVVRVRTTRGPALLDSARLTLDPVGNPLWVTSHHRQQRFIYDALDRLTRACSSKDCRRGHVFTYDAVGNRTSDRTHGRTVKTAYNEADQPTGPSAPTFDHNGNQTSLDGWTAQYDLANRLVELKRAEGPKSGASRHLGGYGADTHISFGYDGLGNRLSERIQRAGHDQGGPHSNKRNGASAASDTTIDLAQDLNAPLSLLAEETAGGRLLRRYVYGDAALSVTTPRGAGYYTRDHLGSVTGVISASGKRQQTYDYDVDGNQAGSLHRSGDRGKGSDNRLTFTGQKWDPAAGLYDLRARAYDPSSARFLQRDPYPRSPLMPSISPYAYADDRPTILVDPSGQCPWCVLAGVGAVVGGAAGAASYWLTTPPAQRTTSGWLGAIGGGAVAGAIGGVAGPLGGTVATSLGFGATSAVAIGTTAGINAAGGIIGTYVKHGFTGTQPSAGELLFAAGGSALGGWFGGTLSPGTGMNTLKQVKYFGPRTWSGALPWSGPNSAAVWSSALIGGIVGVNVDLIRAGLGTATK
jgi:RHS repeat-associated protein